MGITVEPLALPTTPEDLFLVVFRELRPPSKRQQARRPEAGEPTARQLEHQLASARAELQAMLEQHEESTEQLNSANEELLSVNEELQSANEELETSKEELQSLNEELAGVNSQLEANVAELRTTGDDLQNLLTSTELAVLFLDPDLRIRPFFAHGGTTSIREFVIGAFNDEMGLQAVDPLLTAAAAGRRVVTPSGMVLDGSTDFVQAPLARSSSEDPDNDGVRNEIPAALVDYMEFRYLLNYFKPSTYRQTSQTQHGLRLMTQIGCTGCHVQDLRIERDRRVADQTEMA